MIIEKLGPIAEIVGAVAIVVTLAFLTIQTRQNTEALNANARQASLDAELGLIYQLGEAGGALVRANSEQGARELEMESRGDLVRINFLSLALFRIKQHQWMQYRAGLFDDATWRTYEVSLCQLFNNFTVRRNWSQESDNLNPEFIAYLNTWLASALNSEGNCAQGQP